MDKILGGGYPKGGVVLLEQNHTVALWQIRLIVTTTTVNFIAIGRANIIIPTLGMYVENAVRNLQVSYGINESETKHLYQTFESVKGNSEAFQITHLSGDSQVDFEEIEKAAKELKEQTKQPMRFSIGIDTLEALYGRIPLKDISMAVARVRNEGDLMFIRVNSAMRKEFIDAVSSFSDVHIRLVRENGTILFYGVKPRTGLYVLGTDVSKGYPLPKLTPIV